MQYFAPDEDQISKYLGIAQPEPITELKEETEPEHFVGHRKIKLASPASSEAEEEEHDVIVFTKENQEIKPMSKSGKSLKRPSTTTIEELM